MSVRCALCGELMREDEELNRDHVFGEAWGGSARVQTHKTCNQELGGGAEGRLHNSPAVLAFIQMARGLPTRRLRGKTETFSKVLFDLQTEIVEPQHPEVDIVQAGDRIEVEIAGTEQQIREALLRVKHKHPQAPTYDDLPSEAIHRLQEPEEIRLELTHSLGDALTVFKKVALGSGVLAFGPDFAAHLLASGIRGATLASTQLSDDIMLKLWEVGRSMLTQMASADSTVGTFPDPIPAPENQVIFVPLADRRATVVYVHILSLPILGGGILVDQDLPSGTYGERRLPVMVREVDKELIIVDQTERIMASVAELSADALAQAQAEARGEA